MPPNTTALTVTTPAPPPAPPGPAPVLVNIPTRRRRQQAPADRWGFRMEQEETKRYAINACLELLKQPVFQVLTVVVVIEALQKAHIVGSLVGTLAESMAAAPFVIELAKAGADTVEHVAPAIESLAKALAPLALLAAA